MSEILKIMDGSSNVDASPVDIGASPEGNHEDGNRKDSVVDTVPAVEFLTIKNLDTGEAFVIGENDPDFVLDTFALNAGNVWCVQFKCSCGVIRLYCF